METFRNKAKFDFGGIFIFELANNHQGKIDHGLNIVREMSNLAREFGIRGAMKFQFRDLSRIIHPNFEQFSNSNYIPRFLNTKLGEEDFTNLINESRHQGLLTITTPFDEESVGQIEKMGIEVIKIGSPSNQDWPLLEGSRRRISQLFVRRAAFPSRISIRLSVFSTSGPWISR